MASTRLVSSLLLALALAGCGGPSLTGTQARTGAVGASSAEAWVHPSRISTPDDPATAADRSESEAARGAQTGEIINFAKVDDKLFRGGLPSAQNLKELKAMGVKTDITLMGEIPIYDTMMVNREKRWAKEAGLNFVQVKVPTGKVPLSAKMSNVFVDAFLKVALDPANQPCFVHCLHGRDRTGTIVASYQISQHGLTNAQAFAEMKTFGFDENDYPKLAAFVKIYVPTPAGLPGMAL